jgi:2-polyprenyl-6-methoxyphenol hydroxylase-like FAD-dependent oxidoreductase
VTAKVLADRVDHVRLIDRDVLPDDAASRKGVPQGRHAHGLLASGDQVLREQFPGLVEELVAGGGQPVTTSSGRWWQCGGYKAGAPAPDATFYSRPYLERGIRGRIEVLPNVTIMRAAVQGLRTEAGRVVGVTATADDESVSIDADLVVDASGRGSRVAAWLEQLGYPTPPVAEVRIDMGYASRLYRRTPGRVPEKSWYVTIGDVPESKRFGVAFPIDGERWIVTLAGMHGDHAPTDDDGFLGWAKTLPTTDIADLIESEEPLGPIVTHRLPSDQWRHFEKVKHHPAGLIAIGDAICSFNPIYGQGMSSAAQQAAALAATIDRLGIDAADLPAVFYKAAAKVIANPWAIAAGGDFSYPETVGAKPPMVNMLNRYVKRVVIAAQHDPVVGTALWDVMNLLAPPPSLMKPPIMLRVMRASRRGPAGHPVAVPAADVAHAAG